MRGWIQRWANAKTSAFFFLQRSQLTRRFARKSCLLLLHTFYSLLYYYSRLLLGALLTTRCLHTRCTRRALANPAASATTLLTILLLYYFLFTRCWQTRSTCSLTWRRLCAATASPTSLQGCVCLCVCVFVCVYVCVCARLLRRQPRYKGPHTSTLFFVVCGLRGERRCVR